VLPASGVEGGDPDFTKIVADGPVEVRDNGWGFSVAVQGTGFDDIDVVEFELERDGESLGYRATNGRSAKTFYLTWRAAEDGFGQAQIVSTRFTYTPEGETEPRVVIDDTQSKPFLVRPSARLAGSKVSRPAGAKKVKVKTRVEIFDPSAGRKDRGGFIPLAGAKVRVMQSTEKVSQYEYKYKKIAVLKTRADGTVKKKVPADPTASYFMLRLKENKRHGGDSWTTFRSDGSNKI
jgi:hypothetical protein